MPTSGSDEPLPPYSYVPGGPWPHPTSSPRGHSFGRTAPRVVGTGGPAVEISRQFLRGVALFNAGYYWEAHEIWEGLWHAYGRRGVTADVIKALIKLAAAGVKAREGQEHGVRIHSLRAAELLASARKLGASHRLGLDLDLWVERCREIAANPPRDPAPPGTPVVRVFAFRLEVDRDHPAV